MNLTSPISAIAPGGRGVILSILARTEQPLSGRRVAELAGNQLAKSRVLEVLGELAASGIVLVESRPPSLLYELNREHLAAPAIIQLAHLRSALIDRIRAQLTEWTEPAVTAWLFGSAARGEGTETSDIDIAVVRPDSLDADDADWSRQLVELSDAVTRWTGNGTSVIEYAESEIAALVEADERIVASIQSEGIHLGGRRRLLITKAPVR